MKNNDTIIVSLNGLKEINAFGYTFGSEFLGPLVGGPKPEEDQAVVVGAYGPRHSGKTHLLKGAFQGVINAKRELFAWHRKSEEVAFGDVVFRRTDFGYLSPDEKNPDSVHEPWSRDKHNVYLAPRNPNSPGVDFLEHSMASHLGSGGAVIVIGRMRPDTSWNLYVEDTPRIFQVESDILRAGGVQPPYAADLESNAKLVEDIMRRTHDIMLTRLSQTQEVGDGDNRIANVVLTKDNSAARAAFSGFRGQVARNFDLIS